MKIVGEILCSYKQVFFCVSTDSFVRHKI